MLQDQSYIHDIQNTRRQDQMIDFHPHTASTHIRNDYASIDAYIDISAIKKKKNRYKKTTEIHPSNEKTFIYYVLCH
jgi:hypothetical protein